MSINGEEYLPIRSVPAVTSDVIDQRLLASMIGNYENWVGDGYQEVISAFSLRQDGKLLPLSHGLFAAATNAHRSSGSLQIAPAGCVVRKRAVKEKYDIFVCEIWPRSPASIKLDAVWNEDPTLTSIERARIFEGLVLPRSNSRAQVLELLERTMISVEARLLLKGIAIDRSGMLGQKVDWISILQELAPTATRSKPVFEDYLHDLGLRWRQGAARREIYPILKALKS